ncbi:MAG TPA: GDP-mannose 4,6-dehydratase [Solirubrobacteraceae bacterium]|nr:GDP-mannose 4,6-dehydratase [Solirubrobacteraceae bacterium]
MATALITGISGQDGSYLAELLLEEGLAVVGMRRPGEQDLGASEHLRGAVELVDGELLAPATIAAVVRDVAPDHVYHLAAPSFVPDSWRRPGEYVAAITGSCAALLEAVRDHAPAARVVVASSGAMFGDAGESPQSETTPFRPTTPYSVAKLAAHQLVGALRIHDGLHASSAIFFNHESPRRPEQFVTRRVTRGAAAIALGLADELTLGSLDAVRDWSHAADMMRGAWLMARADAADDYVLASGTGRTVADLVRVAFGCLDLDVERHVRVDASLTRAPEPTPSIGDARRARERLGWQPRISFAAMIEEMVAADLAELRAASAAR